MNGVRLSLGFLLVALIGGGPFWYWSYKSTAYRNFRVVEEGRLYRSGQLSESAFRRVCQEYGIRTVITLRDQRDDKERKDDEYEPGYCQLHGIRFYNFPRCNWNPQKDIDSCESNLERFLGILHNPQTEYPILIHCFAGIHRTGAQVAAYRIEFNGWTPQQAIQEMKSMGTPRTNFDQDVLEFFARYTPKRDRR
jgi:protein tyrosine/serine phosphatase